MCLIVVMLTRYSDVLISIAGVNDSFSNVVVGLLSATTAALAGPRSPLGAKRNPRHTRTPSKEIFIVFSLEIRQGPLATPGSGAVNSGCIPLERV